MLQNYKWNYGIRMDIIKAVRKMCLIRKIVRFLLGKLFILYEMMKSANRCTVLRPYPLSQCKSHPCLCELLFWLFPS